MNRPERCTFAFIVALASTSWGVAVAQPPPDLAGTWKAVQGGMDNSLEPFDVDWTLQIEQDDATISLDQSKVSLEQHFLYRLDGMASRNESRSAAGELWLHESQAEWIGGAIVIRMTTTRESGRSWKSLITYSLDLHGRLVFTRMEGALHSRDISTTETIIWEKLSG